MADPQHHPFIRTPHRTLLNLSWPVLLSMVAEPITGLVDTGFVARLGAAPLAALGVGTMAPSSAFWVFNFLGIGSQTKIARAFGARRMEEAAEMGYLAILSAVVIGVLLILAFFSFIPGISSAMGAEGKVHTLAMQYLRIRLWGAPAVLITITGFGILRGLQEMRFPFWVAAGVNGLNIILDAMLIFGAGPIPALGVAGAAMASTISQWCGALWLCVFVYRRLGPPSRLRPKESKALFIIGRDLFIRTGSLTLFLLLATRSATQMGPSAGAAHQAIRQIFMFTALFLDAFAITGQSLIGYFSGSNLIAEARRVAKIVCLWSLGTGLLLMLFMIMGAPLVKKLLVPVSAIPLFSAAWIVAAMFQPVNALAFATDGIHWGTGDFAFLRNVVVAATSVGVSCLFLLGHNDGGLAPIWWITGIWISIRAALGMMRIWPGIGVSPLASG